MKRHVLTFFLAMGFLATVTNAQEFNKVKLDQYFDALEANDKFMGSVAVSKNGQLIYQRSLGFADADHQIKADAATKYRIGSISKTFTAVLVLMAVEEGKLTLQETLDQYFPSIKNAEKISISDLLYHRSGIHNFTDDPDYLNWNTQAKTQQELVTRISASASDFEPGSKAAYSNSNYVLLTYILEKCFQQSYTDLVQQRIADKVGLTHTHVGRKINPAAGEAQSYLYTGSWTLSPETDPSVPVGAGAIVSTPSDLTRFADALFGGRLISAQSLAQMQTINDGFGMGLFPIPFYDHIGLGHTGGIDGFSSVFSHFKEAGVSYALTSNGTNFSNNDISIAVLSAVFGKDFEIPTFNVVEIDPAQFESYVGVYASAMIPLKITIRTENGQLFAQATGQPAFPLEAGGDEHQFTFAAAGVVIDFIPSENALILKQGGGQIRFTKE